jgi:hypothetical protein
LVAIPPSTLRRRPPIPISPTWSPHRRTNVASADHLQRTPLRNTSYG